MVSWFIYFFGCVGITIILTRSSLFESPRHYLSVKSEFIGDLVSCPMCFGMWVGFLSSLFLLNNSLLYAIYYGGAVSLAGYFSETLIGMLNNISYYIESNCEDGE